jgi:hypothetical protein
MSPHLHQQVAQSRIEDLNRAAARHTGVAQLRSARESRIRVAGALRMRLSAIDTIAFALRARRFAR